MANSALLPYFAGQRQEFKGKKTEKIFLNYNFSFLNKNTLVNHYYFKDFLVQWWPPFQEKNMSWHGTFNISCWTILYKTWLKLNSGSLYQSEWLARDPDWPTQLYLISRVMISSKSRIVTIPPRQFSGNVDPLWSRDQSDHHTRLIIRPLWELIIKLILVCIFIYTIVAPWATFLLNLND